MLTVTKLPPKPRGRLGGTHPPRRPICWSRMLPRLTANKKMRLGFQPPQQAPKPTTVLVKRQEGTLPLEARLLWGLHGMISSLEFTARSHRGRMPAARGSGVCLSAPLASPRRRACTWGHPSLGFLLCKRAFHFTLLEMLMTRRRSKMPARGWDKVVRPYSFPSCPSAVSGRGVVL